jgi:hypothetical protein
VRPPLQQRDEQAGRERVACGGAVDGVHARRLRTGDLLPVVEQHGSLGAERHGDETVAPCEHLQLVAVDDGEVGIDGERPRRRGVEAEEPARLLPRCEDGCVRHLELAEDGVRRLQLHSAELGVRPGSDDDLVLAGGVDEDQRHPRGRVGALRLYGQPLLPRQRLVGQRVAADAADERDVGAEPRRRDGLVGPLAAGDPAERRVGDGLAGAGQPAAARDQVEVHRPDDDDRGAIHPPDRDQAAMARRSPTVEPSSVSRRSNSPAHSDDASGAESILAASVRLWSARTSTASSR